MSIFSPRKEAPAPSIDEQIQYIDKILEQCTRLRNSNDVSLFTALITYKHSNIVYHEVFTLKGAEDVIPINELHELIQQVGDLFQAKKLLLLTEKEKNNG